MAETSFNYDIGSESPMPIPNDTSPEAAAIQLQLLREKSPAERADVMLRLTDEVVRLSKRAIRDAHPEFTDDQVSVRFVRLHYGDELADGFQRELERRRNG